MANYSTLLQTWGDTGEAYPSGYSYIEGEQPVDAWDNFAKYNVIQDLKHLIELTNDRIETDKGLAGGEPTSPEASHIYHDTDNEALEFWDGTAGSWHRLLAADGDTLEGALNFDGFAAQNVGPLNMSATADLDGNDLVDGTTTIWDSVNGYVAQTALQNDSVTVTAGNQLSGGGTVALGGSINIDVNEGAGSGLDADTVDGFHASDLGVNIEEDGTLAVSSSTGIDFTGHLNVIDDGDGTVTIDPSHNHDSRYYTESESDSRFVNVSGDSMSGSLGIGGISTGASTDAGTAGASDALGAPWVYTAAVEAHDEKGAASTLIELGAAGSRTNADEIALVTQGNVGLLVDSSVNVNVRNQLKENGNRVYSPNNRPSLGDLSNVSASGEGSGNGFDADTVDGKHASELTTSIATIREQSVFTFGW